LDQQEIKLITKKLTESQKYLKKLIKENHGCNKCENSKGITCDKNLKTGGQAGTYCTYYTTG